MKLHHAICMTFLVAFVDSMSGCLSSSLMTQAPMPSNIARPEPKKDTPKKDFHLQVEAKIPLQLPSGSGELNADVYRPYKMASPKTLVIITPGSGNVSRRGEVSGDGIKSYPRALNMAHEWANSLSDNGFFVLSYDKRTCQSGINQICQNNNQRDLDQDGIIALSRDLDQAYQFAMSKLSDSDTSVRVVLLSSTQGAQAITMAECAKKASGIVLLSPIISELETMWVLGLSKASEQAANIIEKNQLLNRKESTASFFGSLKRGEFPETATVRGASVRFWLSWMDASKNTLKRLINYKRPTFLLFSDQDGFSGKNLIKSIKDETRKSPTIRLSSYADSDRNFITEQGVPKKPLSDVVTFINGLSAISP